MTLTVADGEFRITTDHIFECTLLPYDQENPTTLVTFRDHITLKTLLSI